VAFGRKEDIVQQQSAHSYGKADEANHHNGNAASKRVGEKTKTQSWLRPAPEPADGSSDIHDVRGKNLCLYLSGSEL
jgi:hypothetical protein